MNQKMADKKKELMDKMEQEIDNYINEFEGSMNSNKLNIDVIEGLLIHSKSKLNEHLNTCTTELIKEMDNNIKKK